MNPVYLDNSIATKPSAEAISAMLTFYTEKWGSPKQPHQMGQDLIKPLVEAEFQVMKLLGAGSDDSLLMTTSSQEALNYAILSTHQELAKEGKNHIITALNDDVFIPFGAPVSHLKKDADGLLSALALIELMTPRTALVAVSFASGLTGVIQPILELAEVCRSRGVRFLVEGSSVLGKLPFELKEFPIDLFAFSGEQIHAPKGTGGLYVRRGIHMAPHFLPSSVDVPAVIALGVAAKEAKEARDYMCTEVARLKLFFENEVLKRIPEAKILFQDLERLPNVTAISFPHVVSEALLFLLSRKKIYATLVENGLSFCLSKHTHEEELERAAITLESCFLKLKKTSQHLFKESV